MKKFLKIVLIIYAGICILLFFFQERLIFFPQKLPADYRFNFTQPFEEISINTKDLNKLHGVLFKADSSKGLIFYLHGNAGSIDSWGEVAKTYTVLGYDIFILDYRGYGKSEGSISSQQQLFDDVQLVYNRLRLQYPQEKIIVLGYSLGTGLASKLASANNPKLLILQAPYYSMVDMMRHTYPFIPTFILKYKFTTDEYVQQCKIPIVIFQGDEDEVIYYESSVKLSKYFKKEDKLITLHSQGHNGITDNPEYVKYLSEILK